MFPRSDFPLLERYSELRYLDNAATTQKPRAVLDALIHVYAECNAPVNRGIYALAEQATVVYDAARLRVADALGAAPHEIVFTKGATEGINFIASSWAEKHLKQGDEIIISILEHHANILPWIRLEKERGIALRSIPLTEEGLLDYDVFESMLSSRTKLVSVTHTSNVLGTKVSLERIIKSAHRCGAKVLVDATQAAGREKLELGVKDVDFAVFSGHKMLGPTGSGVLYIAERLQKEVAPYQLGGGMVRSVGLHDYTTDKAPYRYEAGTPSLADVVALGAAFDYLNHFSFSDLQRFEAELCKRLIEGLQQIGHITLLGPLDHLKQRGHMVSFISDRAHAHDLAAYLDTRKIAVRAGNHCAQPLHAFLGIDASVRVSFYGYTGLDDIDALLDALELFQGL